MSVRHEVESPAVKPIANCANIDVLHRDSAAQAQRPVQTQKQPNAPRCSPDPNAGTDRYRLAAPFSFKL